MKVNIANSFNNNHRQNFKGSLSDKVTGKLLKYPGLVGALAGSSVVAQKIIMSGSEATLGPMIDIGIGKAITKATGETDNRTNESSKTQAIRTASQAVGGTITGVIIRGLCIIAASGVLTAMCAKAGEKGAKSAVKCVEKYVNPDKLKKETDPYLFERQIGKWGKSIGGAAAILIMMFTNFLIDVPLINAINKKLTDFIKGTPKEKNVKEAK